MSTERFIGPAGGDWFDPANWSDGIVPMPGDVVQLYGTAGPAIDPSETVSGLTIDLSATGQPPEGGFAGPILDLSAGQLGTASAPVTLDVTADSGTASGAVVEIGQLDGSVDVAAGQGIDFVGGVTVTGDVDIDHGFFGVDGPYIPDINTEPASAVAFDGAVVNDGGTMSLYASSLAGTGSLTLLDGGVLALSNALIQPVEAANFTLPIAFGPGGGTIDARDNTDGLDDPISNFGPGDTIETSPYTLSGAPLALSFSAGTLTVENRYDGRTEQFQFSGSYDPADFQLREAPGGFDVVYGPTSQFTGNDGTDWFDGGNWSRGVVPTGDVTVRLYGTYAVDATGGEITADRLDVSGQITLDAGQIGDAAHPVELDTTPFGGEFDTSTLSFSGLFGSLDDYGDQANVPLDIVAPQSGMTVDGNIDIASEATISGGALTLDGTLFVPGILTISSDLAGDADIALSGTLEVDGGGVASIAAPLAFAPDGGAGRLDVTQNFGGYAGTITGFSYQSVIAARFAAPAYITPTVTYSDGTLVITQQGAPAADAVETFHFDGDYTLANFDVEVRGGQILISYNPCFASGTRVATADGACEVPVEDLAIGDTIALHDGNTACVVWLGRRRQQDGDVIRIRAGALGQLVPARDLFVSDDHGLFLDGVLVPAGLLVNGDTILRERRDTVTFHHVELDRHAILLAEGAPAESYLDTGNRRQFGNCPIGYDPLEAARHEPCAEMIFAGARLARIRNTLPIPA